MARFILVVSALAALAGCSNKKKSEGLPPAQEWGADPGAMPAAGGTPGTAPANPHAGMDMNNPHAGMDMNNPHAGMDMGGGGGTDVSQMGLPPPDPNRAIDPTHRVAGVIRVHPKAADRAAPGGAVFVIVKQADASGQPSGPPLAVEKLTWQKDELPFELTEAQAMIAGTQLTGNVVVTARYDQDGDALSKQPGDIVGETRVTVPADKVTVTLDNVLP